MSSSIALAGLIYAVSIVPWCVLNLQLRGRPWSAFRVFALWSILRVATLVPLVWIDFGLYSELTWPARGITAILEIWLLTEYPPNFVLAGLIVYELFPAISETYSVMWSGGWLRLVPTVSGLIALGIWITGFTKSGSVKEFDSGRPFKRRASGASRRGARTAGA